MYAASAARKMANGKIANRNRYARPAARSNTSSAIDCVTSRLPNRSAGVSGSWGRSGMG